MAGFSGTSSNLLSPDQELAILMDSIMTAEVLIDQLGLEFDNPVELLVFVLMIHEQKLAAVMQALWSGSANLPTPTMP